jgi:hypothetical protein
VKNETCLPAGRNEKLKSDVPVYHAVKAERSVNWGLADVLTDFAYPWNEGLPPAMTFQALWNDERLFFRFEVSGDRFLAAENTHHKMAVVDSDRVEIFFRTDRQMDPYYCLEMDPLSRVLDYRAGYYRQFDFEWQWPGNKTLDVCGVLTTTGYSVEGSVTIASLSQLGLLQNRVLEAGIFRGQCLKLPPDPEFKWISWVLPDSPNPDFHIPSAFGKIILVE